MNTINHFNCVLIIKVGRVAYFCCSWQNYNNMHQVVVMWQIDLCYFIFEYMCTLLICVISNQHIWTFVLVWKPRFLHLKWCFLFCFSYRQTWPGWWFYFLFLYLFSFYSILEGIACFVGLPKASLDWRTRKNFFSSKFSIYQ